MISDFNMPYLTAKKSILFNIWQHLTVDKHECLLFEGGKACNWCLTVFDLTGNNMNRNKC